MDLELVNQCTVCVKDFDVDIFNEVLEVECHLSVVGVGDNAEIMLDTMLLVNV